MPSEPAWDQPLKPAHPRNPGGADAQCLRDAQPAAGCHGAGQRLHFGVDAAHLKVNEILRCLALRVVPILWALPVRPALQGFHLPQLKQPEHKRKAEFTEQALFTAPGLAACDSEYFKSLLFL